MALIRPSVEWLEASKPCLASSKKAASSGSSRQAWATSRAASAGIKPASAWASASTARISSHARVRGSSSKMARVSSVAHELRKMSESEMCAGMRVLMRNPARLFPAHFLPALAVGRHRQVVEVVLERAQPGLFGAQVALGRGGLGWPELHGARRHEEDRLRARQPGLGLGLPGG